jgi:hypothetical protein
MSGSARNQNSVGGGLISSARYLIWEPMEEVLVFQHDPFEDWDFLRGFGESKETDYRICRLFHGEMPEEE